MADLLNHRVQVFSAEGEFLGKWGSEGDDDGQFNRLGGIAVDSSGNVYVTEGAGHRIIEGINHRVQVFSADGEFMGKWSSFGNGDGEFIGPVEIAVAGSGKVYVIDTRNDRVQLFSALVPGR